MNIQEVLKNYNPQEITIAVLGGHSALDVCRGAKKLGFRTLAVCQKDRAQTYAKYYKTRPGNNLPKNYGFNGNKACIDEIILVDQFKDIVLPEIQEQLRAQNAIFVHNRYFWVYCDFQAIENDFRVPIYGNRELVKLEERDHPLNQYVLLEKAGIRTPKIIRKGDSGLSEEQTIDLIGEHFQSGGGPLIIKVNEALRKYERAFFVVANQKSYLDTSKSMLESGKIIAEDLLNAVVEEFVLGAQINFNYFYSNLSGELELMGTDTRRQTSLDGFLRLDAQTQTKLLEQGIKPSMIETGHMNCTCKESLLEKAFLAGEQFVETLKRECEPGMIGPFALQGAIAAENGKESFVVFDVSMRIPGSPGTQFTPYSGYLYGESISYGERIALELRSAIEESRLSEILT